MITELRCLDSHDDILQELGVVLLEVISRYLHAGLILDVV